MFFFVFRGWARRVHSLGNPSKTGRYRYEKYFIVRISVPFKIEVSGFSDTNLKLLNGKMVVYLLSVKAFAYLDII